MKNLHKLYYKDYYKDVGFEITSKNGKDIVKASKPTPNSELLCAKLEQIAKVGVVTDKDTLPLQTLYPGLITGVGIDHEAGVEGEFKLGMHFDYTHGMPVIYGSSVKGVLKTYFVDFAFKYYFDITNQNNKQSEKPCNPKFTRDELIQLSYDIFEGKNRDKEGLKSIYDRDIFFDAVIIEANKGKILDSDTLCPHGDDPLKNPTPICFLKIASGVTIEFRFKLVDSKIGSQTMTKEEKLALFKEILTTVGIGAKTNVGYGQLTEKQTADTAGKNILEQPIKKKIIKVNR